MRPLFLVGSNLERRSRMFNGLQAAIAVDTRVAHRITQGQHSLFRFDDLLLV